MKENEIKQKLEEIKQFDLHKEFSIKWIELGITDDGISYANKLGFYLCQYFWNSKKKFPGYDIGKNSLSNSQIRNVFGEVKRIQMKLSGQKDQEEAWKEVKSSFLLLQPKLAYSSGRVEAKNKKSVLPDLRDVLIKAAKAVKADEKGASKRYQNFVDFLESILAYHKAYGGKEN